MSLTLTQAIYIALNGNISVPVYTAPPMNTPMPYVDMGEMFSREDGTKTYDGHDTRITMHVWSGYQGTKQALTILNEIKAILHNSNLTLVGEQLVLLRFADSHVFRDADEKTIHGVINFRALTTS